MLAGQVSTQGAPPPQLVPVVVTVSILQPVLATLLSAPARQRILMLWPFVAAGKLAVVVM
jgi:hypothetical protein